MGGVGIGAAGVDGLLALVLMLVALALLLALVVSALVLVLVLMQVELALVLLVLVLAGLCCRCRYGQPCCPLLKIALMIHPMSSGSQGWTLVLSSSSLSCGVLVSLSTL